MPNEMINRRSFLSSSSAMIGVSIAQFDPQAGRPGLDQTDLIAEAVQWCKKNGKNLVLEDGEYITRRSVDGTGNSGGQGFGMLGAGPQHCKILHALSEEYPVLDMSGNGRGTVSGFAILPLSESKATAALLVAKGKSGGSSGNTFRISDMVLSAGSQASHCAVVIFNSDLSRIYDSEIGGVGGGGGLSVGFGKSTAVESKFVTMSSELDLTQVYVNETSLHGDAAPALEFTGGAALSVRNIYASLVGDGSAYIMKISSPNRSSGNSLWADVLRTENQSRARGVGALHFAARSLCGGITGNLQSDPDGYAIGSDRGCHVERYTIQINSYYSAFNLGGGICDSDISISARSLGYVDPELSYGLQFKGRLSPVQIFQQLKSSAGVEVSYMGERVTSRD